MAVTPDDVRRMAQLARLAVPEHILPALVTQLNGILDHMQVLSEVQVPADARSTDTDPGTALRDDAPNATPLERDREAFAPAMRDGFFLVPRLATHGSSVGGHATARPDVKAVGDDELGDEDEG